METGRRKEAVARVRLVPGGGSFDVNGRSLEEYFTTRAHRMIVTAPLRIVGKDKDFDVVARIHGGGVNGLAGEDLTSELASGLGRAAVIVLGRHGEGRPTVVVGRDTRASGEWL